jgi:hypothetical protein
MDIACNRICTFYAILLHRDMKIISILQFENEMTICKGIQRVIECVSALYKKKHFRITEFYPEVPNIFHS